MGYARCYPCAFRYRRAAVSVGEADASQTAPHRDVQRARVLLMAADGLANTRIAAAVGVSPATVLAWRGRFGEEG
jgi:DNA-binding NarL/FixJ family response regulator